jgi:hypothetical protein
MPAFASVNADELSARSLTFPPVVANPLAARDFTKKRRGSLPWGFWLTGGPAYSAGRRKVRHHVDSGYFPFAC